MPPDYTVTRTRRRTLAIQVRQGRVEVRAPGGAPQSWIEAFVRDKSRWIEDRLAEYEKKRLERLVIADRREVLFFGIPRTIRVVTTKGRGGVTLDDHNLTITTRNPAPEILEKLFNRWLLEKAREYMVPRTFATARRLGVEDQVKDVRFRKTRSKWGHCKADGTLQYNWLAMMAPPDAIHYLITHECSHLLHLNHSKAFWETVEGICPDYRCQRRWFRDNGHRLWTD